MHRTILSCALFFLLANVVRGQVNLNNGLTAYYPFTGNANDASGNGLNGLVQNGVQLAPDRFGNPNSAYHFDGVNDVILVHDNGALSTPALSIAYYFTSESAGHQICIGKINYLDGNGATYNSGLNVSGGSNTWFNLSSPTSSCFLQIPGTEFFPTVASPVVSLNTWHCLVNTFANGNEKIYLDGLLVSDVNLPFSTSKVCANTDFLIGSWWSGDLRPFKGTLDEVRMYNRALNQDEVNALCNPPSTEYVINDYTPVVAFDPCNNTLKVADAAKFNIGDTVVLMQMKGAQIDSTESSNFGNVVNYKNAGNYEFNIVKRKSGNNIDLLNKLTRQYEIPTGKVQLIRVPFFKDYTVPQGKTLSCLPWDGNKGGVLVLNVLNTLQLDGNIDVNGKGFTGGKGVNTGKLVTNCGQNKYNYPSTSLLAALKGEGITTIGQQIAAGKGSPANGGGGGLDHNSGGGGGSNGGAGGFGGYQLLACTGSAFDNRGIGGKKLINGVTPQKVFMGGGGGAGHCNNQRFNSDGGDGGGIVIIQANQLNIASPLIQISANGENAVECDAATFGSGCHDAGGGGGGGGSILLSVNTVQTALSVNAKGGKGGNVNVFDVSAGEGPIGPGGGGGGGTISFPGITAQTNALFDETGGKNGTIPLDNNDPWGATAGDAGVELPNLILPIDNTIFKPNIDSVTIKNAVANCTSFDFKGFGFTNNTAIATWEWQFGDGNKSTAQNETHIYNSTGQYKVILKGTDGNGCFLTDTTMILITPLVLTKSNDSVICKNSSVQLSVLGAFSYNWSPGTGLNNAGISNPVATPANSVTYHVDATDRNGCKKSDSIRINIRPDPIFTISDVAAICEKTSRQLSSSGGNLYSWQPAASLNDASLPNPVATPPSTTVYNVQITDTVCGNSTALSTTIEVIPSPVIVAHKSNDIDCSIGTSQLSATGGDHYQWTPGSSLSNAGIPNPIASPSVPTTYYVKGMTIDGCSNSDSILVDIKAINSGRFLMPSAFTPNNDGHNDCYGAKSWGYITEFDFKIFNRWGECVFATKNPSQCWDGRFRGIPQKADVYVYIIKARSFCESSVFRKGTVALIR